MCTHERVFFQPWGVERAMATLHSYGCGFERTHCHGLDDGFLGVHGKSETLGACSEISHITEISWI